MKVLALITLSAALLASSGAYAQGLTRAEVRQQLVEAQQNGSRYVTDASYPDVSPVYQGQAAHQQESTNAYGGATAGTTASAGSRHSNAAGYGAPQSCVGPVSFCNLYSGS
jgi:Domain of unknown function (DUF4148)